MRVSLAEFVKDCETSLDKATAEPLTIAHDGRDRLVVLSVEEYERFMRRDRRVCAIEEMTPEQLATSLVICKPDGCSLQEAG